jgi:hypothetical protein
LLLLKYCLAASLEWLRFVFFLLSERGKDLRDDNIRSPDVAPNQFALQMLPRIITRQIIAPTIARHLIGSAFLAALFDDSGNGQIHQSARPARVGKPVLPTRSDESRMQHPLPGIGSARYSYARFKSGIPALSHREAT